MTLKIVSEILNDSGASEIKVTAEIFNLEGGEAHESMRDIVKGITESVSGFDPVTGAPLK